MGEVGGVIFASVGVLLLIGAVNGTWKRAWDALIGTTTTTNTDTATDTSGGANTTTIDALPGTLPGAPPSGE